MRLGRLVVELLLLVKHLVPGAIHVLICIIGVGRCTERVGTRFGNGVDTTTGEATLTNVKRRSYDLNLLNGIHGDGIRAGLGTVCAAAGQTEYIVGNHTVNLERVVTVVRPSDGKSSNLGGVDQWRELCHIIDTAVDGRRVVYLFLIEAGSCAHSTLAGNTRHDNFAQNLSVFFEVGIDNRILTQVQGDV